MNKTWALEYWQDGRIVYIHTFKGTSEQAATTRKQAQSATNCRITLMFLHPDVEVGVLK